MADNVSLKIWNAIEPLVNRKIEEQTRNCQRMKSMTVSTAYSAQTGVVGVQEAFGKEIFLPVISTIDTGKLTVGANVWVSMPYSSMSNAIVTMMGDGDNGNGGYDVANDLTTPEPNVAVLDAYQGKVLLDMVAARNLLDNSDFTNPVNQRGATTYVTNNAYTIDRWILEGTTCWVTSTLISIATGGYLVQRILGNKMSNTKTYTLATMDSSGNIKVGASAGMILFDDGTYGFNTIKIAAGEYLWAALYEGAYTADTLPPYVPKGYAAELAECQRYFVAVSYNNTMLSGNTGDAAGKGARIYLPLGTRMRINPTVSAFVVNVSYYGGAKNNLTFTPSNVETTYTGLCFYGNLSSAVSASPTYVNAVYQIRNADLAISADL